MTNTELKLQAGGPNRVLEFRDSPQRLKPAPRGDRTPAWQKHYRSLSAETKAEVDRLIEHYRDVVEVQANIVIKKGKPPYVDRGALVSVGFEELVRTISQRLSQGSPVESTSCDGRRILMTCLQRGINTAMIRAIIKERSRREKERYGEELIRDKEDATLDQTITADEAIITGTFGKVTDTAMPRPLEFCRLLEPVSKRRKR